MVKSACLLRILRGFSIKSDPRKQEQSMDCVVERSGYEGKPDPLRKGSVRERREETPPQHNR